MKILWGSNSPMGQSGYATQSSLFGPRIAALGHDLAFYSNIGNEHVCMVWGDHKIYPGDHAWGNKTMVACGAHFADGLDDCQFIYLGDAWVLEPERWPKDLRMAIWAPVDHDPIPPNVTRVLRFPQVTPIAMSRFGEQQMRSQGLDPLYVPHGVDTILFRPDPEARAETRRNLGIPENTFVVGMVGLNTGRPLFSRKAFPQLFQAFALFRETHPDALLYVHTNEMALNNDSGGIHLRPLAHACGLPRDAVKFTEQFVWDLGVKREDVARLMNTFDVLACPSFGEGFGIPIIEAQACGVPVITTNWTAMTELTRAGWLVEGDRWYDAPQDSWFKCPGVREIAGALDAAYEARHDQELRAQAREFALGYDVDVVMGKYWKPALERLDRPTVVPPLNRAQRRAAGRQKAVA